MTGFQHDRKHFPRKLQIIHIQWLHSTSTVIPYKKNKSYKIHDNIPPLRQDILW